MCIMSITHVTSPKGHLERQIRKICDESSKKRCEALGRWTVCNYALANVKCRSGLHKFDIPIIILFSSVHFKLMNYIILSKKRWWWIFIEYFLIGDFIHQTYFSLYTIFIFTAWRLCIKKSVTQLHCDCVYIRVI